MILGMSLISISTILLAGPGFQLLRIMRIDLGIPQLLVLLIMFTGIGNGMALPASNNACIELMPDKVATISGLRGMFRSVGGAIGISVITIILHLSSSPACGFRTTFFVFGTGLLLAFPLIFLMPTGKGGMRISKSLK
jgi:MFS family permease